MPALVSSPKELYLALERRPISWATAIAFRIAARAFPAAADCLQPDNENGTGNAVLAIFRALVLARGVMRSADAAHRAIAEKLGDKSMHLKPPFESYGHPAWQCTSNALHMIGIDNDQMAALLSVAHHGEQSAKLIPGETAGFWFAISDDLNALFEQQSAEWLLRQPLWLRYGDNHHVEFYVAQIREFIDTGLSTICDFYDTLLSGNDSFFPGFDKQADREFFQRIIASDDTWWSRTPADVGRDLADWVAELASPTLPTDAELEQNPDVTNFAIDAEGRTVLAPEVGPSGISDSPDAADNHAEIRRLVDAALASTLEAPTQQQEIAAPTQLLRDALGDTIAAVRPRLFVLRARELERRVKELKREDTFAVPLSRLQRDAYLPLVAALAMFRDHDPKLARLWAGDIGGSEPPLAREAMQAIVDALQEVSQTDDAAQEVLETSLAQVPEGALENDARRRTTSEIVLNVCRATYKWAKEIEAGADIVERISKLAHAVSPYVPWLLKLLEKLRDL